MPLSTRRNILVNSFSNGREKRKSIVERMQHRGHSDDFYQVRHLLSCPFQKVSV